jgi:hypothetical protein
MCIRNCTIAIPVCAKRTTAREAGEIGSGEIDSCGTAILDIARIAIRFVYNELLSPDSN